MSSHLHVNTCSTLVQWESHTLSTPTSDNSPLLPNQKTLISIEKFKWNVPQFSFLQPVEKGQLNIHMMKLNNPFKKFTMRIVGTYIWWSKLLFVRSLAFCNLVPSVQANIWPPGTLIVSMEWSWYCHYYLSSLEFWDKTDLPPRE